MENLVILNNESVYTHIVTYLEQFNDTRTAEEYRKDIEQFFKSTRNGKGLQSLSEKDLQYSSSAITNYQNKIRKEYKNATVNRKMSSIRSLFTYLKKDHKNIELENFNVKRLDETEDSQCIDSFETNEVKLLIQEAKKLPDGLEKSLMIELAYETSIRLEALVGACWSNIKPQEGYYIIKVQDKGKKWDTKPITSEFYNRLLQLKSDNDNIFTKSKRTYQRAIEDLVSQLGFDAQRKLTFHSLKKTGIEEVLEQTGNMELASVRGNHSNIQTTHRHYLSVQKKKRVHELAMLQMAKELDMGILEEMSKDELIKLIGSLPLVLKAQILKKAQG